MKPAATQCRNRPMMPASMGKKKVPRRVPFSLRSCGQPRQEPGRNFGFKFVPSVLLPQRQPKTVVPPTSVEAIAAGVPPGFFMGAQVTTVPLVVVEEVMRRTATTYFLLTAVVSVVTYL